MEVLRDQSRCPRPPEGTAVTIGAYDGVHLGHRAVIGQVQARARARGVRSAVVTFDRHPASVVRPESAPRLLTDLEQKLELLAETDIDYCLVITFDEARSEESAEDFVHEVLVACLGARVVVVGEDFHFGHGRRGNVGLLRRMGADLGFDVEGLELVGPDGRPADDRSRVSSTRIRHALVEGDIGTANDLLGRPYEVRGLVAHGDKRGRELGFPTANLSVPGDILLPADGIYAGWYERPGGEVHPAALSLGRRPTFYIEAHASLLEAHLLDDFSGELYDEHARVRFVARLRGEARFDSAEDLIEQMVRDCDDARRVLSVG
ncbi:MAG TPA: bifunctional riboflavin kinase/FAD synthetase [Acidimicrobiales bacterium]